MTRSSSATTVSAIAPSDNQADYCVEVIDKERRYRYKAKKLEMKNKNKLVPLVIKSSKISLVVEVSFCEVALGVTISIKNK
jgi:hypothetical protein